MTELMEDRIKAVMDDWPDLTMVGFFTPLSVTLETDGTEMLKVDRELMLNSLSIDGFAISLEFIEENLKQDNRVNLETSSYDLKNRVVKWARATRGPAHVSNGMFIAAMIDRGYRVGKIDGTNCYFNITRESLKRVNDLYGGDV